MNCKKCKSDRIMTFYAHSKDMGSVEYPNLNIEHDGYFPEIPNICDGDDLNIEVCMDCGQIQGEFPITDDTIKAAVYDDEDEDDVHG